MTICSILTLRRVVKETNVVRQIVVAPDKRARHLEHLAAKNNLKLEPISINSNPNFIS